MAGTPNKPRIVIYGAGQYGGFFTRFAVQKGWPIVAAFNHAGAKVGKDLGQVTGLGRDIGVVIEDSDKADYAALKGKADIAIVAISNLLSVNFPIYERLLGAGLNVACHGSESYHPYGSNPELAAKIDALAKANGVTYTGCGIWDMSRIWSGILLTGPCTEIKSLHHGSITNIESQAPYKERLTRIGIGMTPEQFRASTEIMQNRIMLSYKTVAEQVLKATGYTVTRSITRIEPVVYDEPLNSHVLGSTVPAGACVGSRFAGDVETAEGVTAHTNVELRLFKPGEVEHMFWSVDGMPHTRVRVERDDSAYTTAANLFNRLPDIVAARPGIVLVSEMGPLKHTALENAA